MSTPFSVKSTQCNLFLLNRPKIKDKSVSCNLGLKVKSATGSENDRKKFPAKAKTQNKLVQCKLDTAMFYKHNATQTSIQTTEKNPVNVVDAASQYGEIPLGICIEKAGHIIKSTREFWNLEQEIKRTEDMNYLSVRRKGVTDPIHHVEPVFLTLDNRGMCNFHVLFRTVETFSLLKDGNFDADKFCDLLRMLSNEDYVFCSGVPQGRVVGGVQSVETFEHPYVRSQSKKCEVWLKKSSVIRNKENVSCLKYKFQCLHCKYSSKYLSVIKKKRNSMTPVKKFRRTQVSSNYSINRLTPRSKKKRVNLIKNNRRTMQRKIEKLEHQLREKDVLLNKHQSAELQDIIQEINNNHQKDLDTIIEQNGENKDLLKERDSKKRQIVDTSDFFRDQLKNKTGDRGNTWSSITYRLALAVYSRSKAAYSALKNFNILQLPSLKSLQVKSGKFLDPPGINHNYLQEQSAKYKLFQEEKRKKGEKVPTNSGVLIFDEVKVIDKLMWNSKNHEFVGIAMTPEEFPQLFDVITHKSASTQEPNAAKFMIQFLWRDLTSNFDLIGPYFSCESSLDHKFMMGCVLETVRCLEAYDFNVMCMVCDGASENLALIKATMGHKGVFGYRNNHGLLDFSIQPNFPNPWRPGHQIHWLICPSHQMKNMISALHSSRQGGTKCFNTNDAPFGWENIKKLKLREEERFANGILRYEPKLLQSFIERDSWTRLNVKPSKIFQQENILSELFDYSQSNNDDANSAYNCYKYLRSCNRMFEQGYFSKRGVSDVNSAEITSIFTGYNYFEQWIRDENLLPQFPKNSNVNCENPL